MEDLLVRRASTNPSPRTSNICRKPHFPVGEMRLPAKARSLLNWLVSTFFTQKKAARSYCLECTFVSVIDRDGRGEWGRGHQRIRRVGCANCAMPASHLEHLPGWGLTRLPPVLSTGSQALPASLTRWSRRFFQHLRRLRDP